MVVLHQGGWWPGKADGWNFNLITGDYRSIIAQSAAPRNPGKCDHTWTEAQGQDTNDSRGQSPKYQRTCMRIDGWSKSRMSESTQDVLLLGCHRGVFWRTISSDLRTSTPIRRVQTRGGGSFILFIFFYISCTSNMNNTMETKQFISRHPASFSCPGTLLLEKPKPLIMAATSQFR